MRKLIWGFVERTYHKVSFLTFVLFRFLSAVKKLEIDERINALGDYGFGILYENKPIRMWPERPSVRWRIKYSTVHLEIKKKKQKKKKKKKNNNKKTAIKDRKNLR